MLCPSRKQGFRNFNTARKQAANQATRAYHANRVFAPLYGYRCQCGQIHLTSRRKWDNKPHVLLASIRAPKLIAERAYTMGRIEAYAT